MTNLQPGKEVTLQTMDGQEYCYQVATLETLTAPYREERRRAASEAAKAAASNLTRSMI